MRRASTAALAVICLWGAVSAPATAQTASDLNALAAAENVAFALLAYHRTRMTFARDTTQLNLCATRYRSAIPLSAAARERVSEVVGAARREPCDPRSAGAAAGRPRVVIDSVTITLTRATVFARVRRGEDRYAETAHLELGRPAFTTWTVRRIEIADFGRVR